MGVAGVALGLAWTQVGGKVRIPHWGRESSTGENEMRDRKWIYNFQLLLLRLKNEVSF